MHYYKRNLGDYAKKAGRLSMLQHGSYTLLIDSCYDREQFPTLDEAIEWTWASSKEERESVEFVLNKFFVKQEDGRYVQSRIEEELNEYHEKAITNKRIAEEREAKRKESKTNRERTVNESPPNHKPRTINQEPLTKNHNKEEPLAIAIAPKFDFKKSLIDLGVEEKNIFAWMQVRKLKKAANTEIAMQALIRESAKAGMSVNDAVLISAERNWQGFNADWVLNPSNGQKKSSHTNFSAIDYTQGVNEDGSF